MLSIGDKWADLIQGRTDQFIAQSFTIWESLPKSDKFGIFQLLYQFLLIDNCVIYSRINQFKQSCSWERQGG